jgi:hypothetical protein
VRKVVKRVDVRPSRLEISLGEFELVSNLIPSPNTPASVLKPSERNRLIRIGTNFTVHRSRGQLTLTVPTSEIPPESRADLPLIKAVVRAHEWKNRILEGKAYSNSALARLAGLSEQYVSKVTDCAFLAPDIVEAILDGRQPRDLTFAKLRRHIPLDWNEQRNLFGFPST